MNNVISTKVKVFRNVKDYKFTPKLEDAKKQEILNKLTVALNGKLSAINLDNIDEKTLKSLKAEGLIENPKYNTIFVNAKNKCSLTLFDGEHITITATGEGWDKSTFTNANELATLLQNTISLTYNDTYGYLMSNLNNLGCGVKIECVLDLNSLVSLGKLDQVKQNVQKLGFVLSETNNKNYFKLSTVCNLGFSQSEIYAEFEKMVGMVQNLEVESAKMLDVSNHDELLDSAFRSLAILNSAYLIDYDELKTLLSNLRTGLNLGIINLNLSTINKLQTLANSGVGEFSSKTENLNLAKQIKDILKGEKNV